MHTNGLLTRITRHRSSTWLIAAGLFLGGGVSIAAGSAWKPLGEPIRASSSTFAEVVASRHTLSPALAARPPFLYLAWTELDLHGVPQLHLQHWAGRSWVKDGGSLNRFKERRAYEPALASDGKALFLAWIELSWRNVPTLYFSRLADGQWTPEPAGLNIDSDRPAANPALSANPSGAFLFWSEQNAGRVFQLHARRLTPDVGRAAGDAPLNVSAARDAIRPSVAQSGNTVYAAWMEQSDQLFYQVYVKQWTGSDWRPLGGSLNIQAGRHAMNPSIALQGETPYLAWTEIDDGGRSRLYLKHWKGAEWAPDGEALDQDSSGHALSPSLWGNESGLFLTWKEYDAGGPSRVHIRRKTTSGWAEIETRTGTADAAAPVLAGAGRTAYAATKEMDSNGLFHIVVRRLEAD